MIGMRIALAGNPNSGKTTMYNALTGRTERVGNWAGVTVDKKESPIKKTFCGAYSDLVAVDLPGAYSMSPFTSEEGITSAYVKNEHPDAIINIVDATNLSRSLFFTTQLLELGIPVVVALNKSDINEKKETKIDTAFFLKSLGVPLWKPFLLLRLIKDWHRPFRRQHPHKAKAKPLPMYRMTSIFMISKP